VRFSGGDVGNALAENVTLLTIDTISISRAVAVLERCLNLIPFKHVKLISPLPCKCPWLTHIPPETLNATMPLNAYSDFCIRHLHEYFETSHCLIVQYDGWLVNPEAWRDEWLALDYIGCIADWTEPGDNGKGGCGGFSLRSRRLMELAARIADKTHEEDVILSHARPRGRRDDFEAAGMKFAPNTVQFQWGYDAGHWRGEFGHHRARELGPYPERCRQNV
jgi:hypothetical protein